MKPAELVKEYWFETIKYKVKAAQVIALFVITIGLAWYTNEWMKDDGHVESFRVAHSAAAGIMFLIPVIFISFLRGIQEMIGSCLVGRLLVFDVLIHKVAAVVMFLLSIIHGVAHGYFDMNNYTNSYGWTGWIMYFCMLIFLVVLLPYFRNWLNGFNSKFLRPHKLAALVMLICYWIHYPVERTKKLWPYCIAITVLFLLDRLIVHAKYTHKLRISFYHTRVLDDETFVLSLIKPEGMKTKPAQYAQLIFPALSPIASHPFSISSSPDSPTIDFMVRVTGDWTGGFHVMLKDKEFMKRHSTLYMVGPFTEHSIVDAIYENEFAFIAAGAGLGPFLNLVRSRQGYCDAVNIVAHVTSRNFCDFQLLLEAISDAFQTGVSSEVYIYWTGPDENKRERLRERVSKYGFVFHTGQTPTKGGSDNNSEQSCEEVASLDGSHAKERQVYVMNRTPDINLNKMITPHSLFDQKNEASGNNLEVKTVLNRRATSERRKSILERRETARFSRQFSLNQQRKGSQPIDTQDPDNNHNDIEMGEIHTAQKPVLTSKITSVSNQKDDLTTMDGILERNYSPLVQVYFRENRLDMEEVLASTSENIYYVGPAALSNFLNSVCVQHNRKLLYTTWS
mmetsp:Transcript_43889/g.50498  ORF Transcript_43889/g.50498 Transcript_43889/m.50498 type:complete len:622 (+) Transcript_43889:74-1939(+)|eukprot:CAMPEP_0115028474 /NCGR_PEP_ID=MMETSP0216-20121206/36323_1 /TAXON_ID=223996 /ORGANISM="Protocruzia adherens, Strain Boccale" /LENGTH=621 /DNA_ID=CAMNT_0002404667 /DNA_START=54 /DNA_END=1919 /DNA_ORIENTATION=+